MLAYKFLLYPNKERRLLYKFERRSSKSAWSSFKQKLAYKAVRAGKLYVQVDAKGTNQVCSVCGNMVPKTLNERRRLFPKCGIQVSREYNASLVILARGMKKVRSERPELMLVDNRPLPASAQAQQVVWMKQEALPARTG